MKLKKLYSAKFKKDYVAASAVIIFIGLVALEIMLAVAIPLHLRSDQVWAHQVLRQQTLTLFDSLRNNIANVQPNGKQVAGEMQLLSDNLDRLAVFLRTNNKQLTTEQFQLLREDLQFMNQVFNRLKANRPYGEPRTLDPAAFMKQIIQQADTIEQQRPAQ